MDSFILMKISNTSNMVIIDIHLELSIFDERFNILKLAKSVS